MTDNEFRICEAACCLWEEMLLQRGSDSHISKLIENAGHGQARMCAIAIAPYAESAYRRIPEDQRDTSSYDWEYIPWFLDKCCDFTGDGAYIYADPLKILKPNYERLVLEYGLKPILGWQVYNEEADLYWADRTSFEILDDSMAMNDLFQAHSSGAYGFQLKTVRVGDIEQPEFLVS